MLESPPKKPIPTENINPANRTQTHRTRTNKNPNKQNPNTQNINKQKPKHTEHKQTECKQTEHKQTGHKQTETQTHRTQQDKNTDPHPFQHWSLRGCVDTLVNCQILVDSKISSQTRSEQYRKYGFKISLCTIGYWIFCELTVSGICGRGQAGQDPGIERAYIFFGSTLRVNLPPSPHLPNQPQPQTQKISIGCGGQRGGQSQRTTPSGGV